MRFHKKSKDVLDALAKSWRIRFAWTPVRINDNEIVWLTKYAEMSTPRSKWPSNKVWYKSTKNKAYCDAEELLKARLAGELWASVPASLYSSDGETQASAKVSNINTRYS